jgi:hypothetical protein
MNTTPIEKCAIGLEAEYDVKVATERGWSKFEIFPNGNLIGTSPMGETEMPVPRYRRALNNAAPDLLAACEFALKYHRMKIEQGKDSFPAQLVTALKSAIASAKNEG